MNNNTVALQQARVASFATLALQAISEFAILDADEDEKQKRAKSSPNQRCRWAEYVRLSKDKPMFRRHFRMTYDSFCLLLNQIQEHLHAPDEEMAALKGGPIIPELKLYATIRYLAGTPYTDICYFCGISQAAFYGRQSMPSTRASKLVFHHRQRTVQLLHPPSKG